MVIKHTNNVHEIVFKGKEAKVALLSDLHWDNPKCDRALLKKHLDYCKEHQIPVHINGDMFCLMQGKGDRRGNKSDILPEHNNARYLDSVIQTAVEWFTPYKDILTVIGYGNHETSIIKWQETDVLQRFVDIFNYENKTELQTGGYGGWMIYRMLMNSTQESSFRHKYFHGSGGGGIVTKGAINLTRAMEMYGEMDMFSMGHIHENSCRNDVREFLMSHSQKGYFTAHKTTHMALTGTYKEEYGDGSKGWHIERGAPPKPVGGRIAVLSVARVQANGQDKTIKQIDTIKFPI
jgi:hypothetical protein